MKTNTKSTKSKSKEKGKTTHGHLTMRFPMKSSADFEAAQKQISTHVAELYRAADSMGTFHYCRFIALKDVIYLLADFDGELDTVFEDLPKHFGPFLDPLLSYVKNAPPTPIANNAKAFAVWAKANRIKFYIDYSAYPGATVKEIRSLATNAGIEMDVASAHQLPLLVIMPMKSRLAIATLGTGLKLLKGYLAKGGDAVGTVHFAHLVELPDEKLGFFTIYDGPFDKYAQDFADQLGPAFDLMFKFTRNPAPTPTSKNAGPFTKWVRDHDLKPLAFYSGYPGLQVQDVKALLAEA